MFINFWFYLFTGTMVKHFITWFLNYRRTDRGQVMRRCDDPQNPLRQTRGIKTTTYNPINTSLPLSDLCMSLQTIDKSCLFLSVVNLDDQQKFVHTKFGKFPMGSPIGVQQKLQSDYSLNILDTEDFPSLPLQNLMVNNVSIVLDHTKLLKLESLAVTEDQVRDIEKSTRLQSQDPKWHQIRQDRITASVAGDIIKRRKGQYSRINYSKP